MANGARMEGIEADLFFTFFGLDAIRKDRYEKIKLSVSPQRLSLLSLGA
jgi:peroxiredoxin family protein